MVTLSAAGAAPGVTVMVVVRVIANHVTVMVTEVVDVTALVVTGNAALEAPPLTTRSAGTWTTAGLLDARSTDAPSVAAVKSTVPVADPLPTTLVGATDTAASDAPAGVAWLTTSVAVRGTLAIAAVMVTKVSGANAFDVIVKVADDEPAGTTTAAGTAAAPGALLNRSTVVGTVSAKPVVTVPCELAPSRTWSGLTDNEEMKLARAVPGRPNTVAETTSVVRSTRERRMRPESPTATHGALTLGKVAWLFPLGKRSRSAAAGRGQRGPGVGRHVDAHPAVVVAGHQDRQDVSEGQGDPAGEMYGDRSRVDLRL